MMIPRNLRDRENDLRLRHLEVCALARLSPDDRSPRLGECQTCEALALVIEWAMLPRRDLDALRDARRKAGRLHRGMVGLCIEDASPERLLEAREAWAEIPPEWEDA